MGWLKGKKSFLIAAAMIGVGGTNMANAQVAMDGVMQLMGSDSGRLIMEGLGLGALRASIAGK